MNDQHITGSELRSLILGKWGRSYDARLQKRGSRCSLCSCTLMSQAAGLSIDSFCCALPGSGLLHSLTDGLMALCRTYFHIMWRYLEQRSFPMSESQYMDQLNAVAHCLTEWGTASAVRSGIQTAPAKGPGYTGGGGARAVSS